MLKLSYIFVFCNWVTNKRNGKSAISASDNFTSQSANPREIHKGNIGPNPSTGSVSLAHDTSLDGSKYDNEIEKEIVKNNAVSMDDPIIVDISGAFHHLFFLNLSKIVISIRLATENAHPDPSAIRS